MRAITVTEPGPPQNLRIADVEDPRPGSGDLLIRVAAAGVNRADLMQRQGHYPPPPGASPIIGLEVSGTIAGVGDDVTGWSVGDPCVALLAGGGYAELVAAPAGQVIPPPPGVDLVTAGGVIEVAATVQSNLDRAALAAGEVFLVHGGAGGIGSFAIPYAKSVGATVIATAGSAGKLDYCRAIGADHALSYRDDWANGVREVTDGRGPDVVLDNMGAKYLATHIDVLATDGRLMIIGLQGGTKAELDIGALLGKRGAVIAMSLRSRPVAQKAAICARVLESVWPLIASGAITLPTPRTYPLDQAAAAHALLESGDHQGKTVLIP